MGEFSRMPRINNQPWHLEPAEHLDRTGGATLEFQVACCRAIMVRAQDVASG